MGDEGSGERPTFRLPAGKHEGVRRGFPVLTTHPLIHPGMNPELEGNDTMLTEVFTDLTADLTDARW